MKIAFASSKLIIWICFIHGNFIGLFISLQQQTFFTIAGITSAIALLDKKMNVSTSFNKYNY